MIGPFGHLGADASALVDERLDAEDRRRALEHVAICCECSDLVLEQQRQRRLTGTLGEVAVPQTLQERLIAMAAAAEALDSPGASPAVARAPWETSSPSRSRTAMRFTVLGAASVAGFSLVASGALFVIGGRTVSTPDHLTAAAAPTTTFHAVGVSSRSADVAWPQGSAHPSELHPGTEIVEIGELEGGVLRVDLSVDGTPVTVLESAGELRLDAAEISKSVRIGDLEAHLVDGWWMAQAGKDVVAVSSDDDAACLEVLSQFPAAADADVLDRVVRGWRVVFG